MKNLLCKVKFTLLPNSRQISFFQNTKEKFGGKKFTWQRDEVLLK
jgi:hypothetical protein